ESVPTWLTNRQRDYDSGEDMHQVSIELKMTQEEDINRLKKIKCYRGVRHASGHKVRGQRTYSNGRRGLALGVSRKKVLANK
ncbi:MAG: 30S ribosomal protein S13, partial [Candidatus Poseidoniia archaeon]|nr:30S ribosomal protein S13 [Candidatus Poseidoniia archaeon]